MAASGRVRLLVSFSVVLWTLLPHICKSTSNCTKGFYYSESVDTCKKCTECPADEEQVQPCTSTSNTVCRCITGYYRENLACSPCSSCGNRDIRHICTPDSDTVCGDCPYGWALYTNNLCVICSQCGPNSIQMKECQVDGIPSWYQCIPSEGYNKTFNDSYIPPKATTGVFISSTTVDLVNSEGTESSTEIVIVGFASIGFLAIMLIITMLSLCCCALLCCRKCKESRVWRNISLRRTTVHPEPIGDADGKHVC